MSEFFDTATDGTEHLGFFKQVDTGVQNYGKVNYYAFVPALAIETYFSNMMLFEWNTASLIMHPTECPIEASTNGKNCLT